MRSLIICILLLFPLSLGAQESDNRIRVNAGLKVGFQAITYNNPTFGIDGYTYNENTIQSNKVGYTVAPFLRLSHGRFYLQTEAALGITRHSFDFTDTREGSIAGITPNIPIYDLRTYCLQVPILFGYNFVMQSSYGMSLFTGPKTKFIFTAHDRQQFKHFAYDDLEEVLEKKTYYWGVGLGVKIYNVFFDFVYDLGLTDPSKFIRAPKVRKEFSTKRRDNILSFSVGIIF
jgi:hypothetical protein